MSAGPQPLVAITTYGDVARNVVMPAMIAANRLAIRLGEHTLGLDPILGLRYQGPFSTCRSATTIWQTTCRKIS